MAHVHNGIEGCHPYHGMPTGPMANAEVAACILMHELRTSRDLQQTFWGSIPSLTLLHPWLLLLLVPMAVMPVAART